MDRRAWSATVHGVTKSQTQLSDYAQHRFIFIYPPEVNLTSFIYEFKPFISIRGRNTLPLQTLCASHFLSPLQRKLQ